MGLNKVSWYTLYATVACEAVKVVNLHNVTGTNSVDYVNAIIKIWFSSGQSS